ncbi:H/ACA ribonucleoprotein complex subunit GAR1-like [Papaver somniferum]|uniref:H/ACA ribonucleoprotein complex subunit GAR1-like n=1 Tax=Papaver somniferum TaxID=3469 RepID=UPI000E6F61D4|nr:H/ACA ribonucleoprotein complex subunit GAR1-like [Papaver somniferum]
MTSQLPFGEMTMTPDDAKAITGLALEGKVVYGGFNSSLPYDALYVLAKHCLGWSKDQTEEEIGYGVAPREQAPSKQGKGGRGEKGGRAGTSVRGGKKGGRAGTTTARGGTSAARGGRGGGKKTPTQAGKGK